MGSLYEPSIRGSTFSEAPPKRFSARFTTLEGWRELGLGVYAMGQSNIRMFNIRNQFEPEHYHDDHEEEYQEKFEEEVDFTFTNPRDAPPVPRIPSSIGTSSIGTQRNEEGTIGKAIGSLRDTKGGALRHQTSQSTRNSAPYHVLTRREKWTMVWIVGAAGIFPALTFFIYLPSMARIAMEFNRPLEKAHLTVTTFLIGQAFAPLMWQPLADTFGRRTMYIWAFLTYITSSIVLSFSPDFKLILFFRAFHTASSTISVGCAIIQDITLPSERDDFYFFYQGVRDVTIVIAPVLGGIIAQWANFRCIFIFLFSLSLAVLAVILLFLPETLRPIAGNGSLPLKGIHQPLIWRMKVFGKPAHVDEASQPGPRPRLNSGKFSVPFRLLGEKDIALSLMFSSVVFAIWMMVTVSTVGLFKTAFGLNEIFIGLAFIPNAIGMIAGSALIGNLLNQDYLKACLSYRRDHALPPSTTISKHPLPCDFPIEHTRLKHLPGLTVIFLMALSIYGFTLYYPSLTSLGGWIAIPLLLQLLISAMAHSISGVHQTLVQDLWPRDGAAAANIGNLVKYTLAAIGVGLIQPMLESIEVGPTFLALGLVVLTLVPLPIVQWYWGCTWRRRRDALRNYAAPIELPEKV